MTDDDQIFKGVALNKPNIFDAVSIQKSVNDFLVDRPEAKVGALVKVSTTEGVNLVIATRVNNKFFVDAYIGKKWGKPIEGGIEGVVYF